MCIRDRHIRDTANMTHVSQTNNVGTVANYAPTTRLSLTQRTSGAHSVFFSRKFVCFEEGVMSIKLRCKCAQKVWFNAKFMHKDAFNLHAFTYHKMLVHGALAPAAASKI